MQQFNLAEHWTLKQRNPATSLEDDRAGQDGWHPATVPGVVQGDLLSLGLIPDPFHEMNETAVQWVGETDWLYRCQFQWTPADADEAETTLCFGGLDTFATVWLNGQLILVSDNMFLAHRVPVQALLTAGDNELILLFESALRLGQAREAEMGKRAVWNGDPSRVYVRKAQYHYGWDWGPCLLTAGPWQPVWLERSTARIAEMECPIEISDNLQSARLQAQVTIENAAKLPSGTVQLALYDPHDALIDQVMFSMGEITFQHVFVVEQPELWWPHDFGVQSRYRLVATLLQDDITIEQQEQRLGVRSVRLLQEKIEREEGKSFRIEVNNTPLFCGGANWIPADMILTRVSDDHYRTLLQQAVDAHMSMIRVWGGGIYEADIFYDLCDELGLLVWQDFLFACGMYPAHEAFMQSVRAEAESAVRRLRHHPCLALWCGNNEDYDIATSLGQPITGPVTDTFPARAIYEHLLPEICAKLDPDRPYWPGSPYGGAGNNDRAEGDQHLWSIWHQALAPYQDYSQYGGRFVTEFGMVALPSATAIAEMANPLERYPGSRVLDFHFKAEGGVRRLAIYLGENVRIPADITHYAYATQLMQSEAIAAAYRGWRRQFQGPGRYGCSGALVWQLNDCWPCISWSVIDSDLVPKMAYYAMRRALAPIALEMGYGDSETTSALWAANSTSEEMHGVVQVRRWSLSGQIDREDERAIVLAPHQTTPLGDIDLTVDPTHILQARLLVNGMVEARTSLWPEPLKYLTLPDPEIAIESLSGGELRLRANVPAKSVWLDGNERIDWNDNGFDLFPDEVYTIHAANFTGQPVRMQSMFDLQPR